jgi:energy-coupling factor transporter ATP-binding protein EcfA2
MYNTEKNLDTAQTFPSSPTPQKRTAQGAWTDLALHTLGWKAFQDLCAHVCEDVMNVPVEVYREAQDGGQDAVFVSKSAGVDGKSPTTTVQCKFSSNGSRQLKLTALDEELGHITTLKQQGQVDRYLFMTSMSVSGPTAIAIKKRLRGLGVIHPHVFGKEYLVRVIRSNAKLRALVPRIYGLGDLSMILDERRAAQTKSLLGHMASSLRAYVPTAPHVQAVRALSKHKIVLLVGNPATGKSTIAAVLSTIAADSPNHVCYKADGPKQLLDNWNPEEGGGFYWIDDAFGPNQLREDFVDHWISIMPKLLAATAAGNSFVLTSRRHIYEAAKPKLGTRNHPLFRDETAIVEVGLLSQIERRQILYNHIKSGDQPKHWKLAVKNELDVLSQERAFTPETARQLGDPAYTANVTAYVDSLLTFVRENRSFLLQTVGELSKAHRAALTLVFLHRGRMPLSGSLPEIQEIVIRFYEVSRETLADSLNELRESFLVEVADGTRRVWNFKHPTLSDALAATLREAEGMRELYIRGVGVETILSDVLCDGVEHIPDAVVIPESLNTLLVDRLVETPDDGSKINRLLFYFLWQRASDEVFRQVLQSDITILSRNAWASREVAFDPKINVFARAFADGVLPAELRSAMGKRIENDLFCELDASFLDR